MWNIIYDFGYKFLQTIGNLWNWLITPIDIFQDLLNVDIAPIYIVTGAAIITGLVRRIL